VTEADWLSCADPAAMLHFLRLRASDRKLRLFAAACCRLVWDHLPGPLAREAVETAERYADGLAGDDEREAARRALHQAAAAERGARGRLTQAAAELLRARPSARLVAERARTGRGASLLPARQCGLLRDLFGDPFGRVIVAPLREAAPAAGELAETIDRGRAFERLPELADALERAGCRHPAALAHCRRPGEHARGCWVLDAVLEKQ
jgi:hypothetical protein